MVMESLDLQLLFHHCVLFALLPCLLSCLLYVLVPTGDQRRCPGQPAEAAIPLSQTASPFMSPSGHADLGTLGPPGRSHRGACRVIIYFEKCGRGHFEKYLYDVRYGMDG